MKQSVCCLQSMTYYHWWSNTYIVVGISVVIPRVVVVAAAFAFAATAAAAFAFAAAAAAAVIAAAAAAACDNVLSLVDQ